MFGPAVAYVVAAAAMFFAAISALTLIYAVNHFDLPETHSSLDGFHETSAVA